MPELQPYDGYTTINGARVQPVTNPYEEHLRRAVLDALAQQPVAHQQPVNIYLPSAPVEPVSAHIARTVNWTRVIIGGFIAVCVMIAIPYLFVSWYTATPTPVVVQSNPNCHWAVLGTCS
ncbi:MAG: hypothetical protein LC749_01840 [Actinobacteria bacterium]|nr:hypothetical protein [Actinomycetota bacterium]